jgi:hypothetical protein
MDKRQPLNINKMTMTFRNWRFDTREDAEALREAAEAFAVAVGKLVEDLYGLELDAVNEVLARHEVST